MNRTLELLRAIFRKCVNEWEWLDRAPSVRMLKESTRTQVDLARRVAWIHPDQAKGRKAIPVPLNAEAVLLVRKLAGNHPTHMSSFHGKPITQVSTKRLALRAVQSEIHGTNTAQV